MEVWNHRITNVLTQCMQLIFTDVAIQYNCKTITESPVTLKIFVLQSTKEDTAIKVDYILRLCLDMLCTHPVLISFSFHDTTHLFDPCTFCCGAI